MVTRHMSTVALLALFSLALMLTGCSSDDPVAPVETNLTADKDAAEIIAADLGAVDGGMTDQLADLGAAVGGLASAKADGDGAFRDAVYDEVSGTWTITVERERGDVDGVPYAFIARTYTLRLLDVDGQPMPFRVVDGDTARTAEFAIVSGTGLHRTRRVEQHLDSLAGAFLVTGLNTELLTVNGTYERSAGNHLETARFERTVDSVLSVQLSDVVIPLGAGRDISQAVSGTLSGTFVADITFVRDEAYTERHVEREFSVVIGEGEAEIGIDHLRWRAHLGNGELIED